MLKKYINKQTLIAFSIGALLFSATPIKAATDYVTAYLNNNQKVTVNGAEQQIRFLNASDTNYGSVRDIVNAMGGNIDYINATDTIAITTSAEAVTPVATPSPTPSTSANKNTEVTNMSTITETPDGLKVYQFNNNYYIDWLSLRKKCESNGYNFEITNNEFLIKDSQNTVIKKITMVKTINGTNDAIEYNDYINNIINVFK